MIWNDPKEEKMLSNRRTLLKLAGAATAVAGVAWAAAPVSAQTVGQFRAIKALAFDAYGTLFDVFSVTALCEQLFPGKGTQLAQIWRFKQLQYSLMRSLMGRHRDFWGLTEDGLVWASKNLQLDLTAEKKKQLMDAYLSLAAFPDVKPGLEALKKQGLKLAILSNGEPKMLEAAAKSAGIRDLLDEIISVEEVKIFKTSNRVYWLATERLQVSNPELGFISANNWDGVAAVSAGLRTFWIQRSAAEVPEELGFQVDATVKAITDLPALLRG
jgi:2-haloacid dehalogenase